MIHSGLFRIAPQGGVAAYKTFSVHAPLATHWRPATCAEIDCEQYLRGWVTKVDTSTELGQRQTHYITKECGRRYTLHRVPPLLRFEFEAGQPCFAYTKHRVPLERTPILISRGGDFRGNPTGRQRVHVRVDDWIDEFANHQIRLKESLDHG